MSSFSSKPIVPSKLALTIRRHPFAFFGLPFVCTLVAGSFALSSLTQTRYDLRDEKVSAVTREAELGMKKGRRKFDVREEYMRLQGSGEMDTVDDWENKRVDRLPGQAQWGELPVTKK
ncbi:cytochrome c oxidase assembly protein subunit 16, partial [Phenoliferia sp. Uapishka_3]